MLARPDRTLRQDVLALHLDEAAYLWTEREAALASADHTLAEVADGPERRLLCHLDALAVGGARAAARLLLPALASEEAEVRGAAALALTFPGEGRDLAAVAAAAAEASGEVRAPLLRALALCDAPDAAQPLLAVLRGEDPGLVADALDALSFRRAAPAPEVARLLSHPAPEVHAAALRALRLVPGGAEAGAVQAALSAPAPALRLAALLTAAVGGSRDALAACRRDLAAPGALGAAARLLLALAGDARDVDALAALLEDEALRRDALVALGYSGRPAAVDAALPWVADPAVGAVAAEAVSAVTGIDVAGPLALDPGPAPDEDDGEPPPLEVDLASSLLPGADDDLPLADPELLARAWAERRPRLPAAGRFLRGRPLDLGALVAELETGPARRRAGLALELAVRSRGAVQVEPLALVAVQRRQLGAARALRGGAAPSAPLAPPA